MNSTRSLIITIVISALVISATLIYVGQELAQDSTLSESVIKKQLRDALTENDFLARELKSGLESLEKTRLAEKRQQRLQQRKVAQEKAKNVRPVSADRDHIRGNPEALISLIEYSDFECPYCKRFHATPRRLLSEFKDRVNWVYRHFPLSFHNPGAQKQAEASECAHEQGGNDAFWKFADTIFARTRGGGKGFPLGNLPKLATELGLDGKTFQQCLDSRKHAARVREDLRDGSKAGIRGTPGVIIINNKTGDLAVIDGAKPYNTVKTAVTRLLARSTASRGDNSQSN